MDNEGPDRADFWIPFAVVIYWTRGISLKPNMLAKKQKQFIWPSSTLKLSIWSVACRSRLLGWSIRFWFKISPPTTDSSYKVTYSFWLCVCTRCLSICAPSVVAVVWCNWVLRVITFGVRDTPKTVSRNLKHHWFINYIHDSNSIGWCLFTTMSYGIHTCVWLRRKHGQGKQCEKHKENDVDKHVE